MAHNVALPKHVYCFVRQSFVYSSGAEDALVPCVWFAISSHPGRAMGCHVMLENGAVVLELPLHALIPSDQEELPRPDRILTPRNVQRWDCFGWDAEVFEVPYLQDLSVQILNDDHTPSLYAGQPLFFIDWKDNGFSNYPEQHKWMIVVRHDLNYFMALPQDLMVFRDDSFTRSDDTMLKRIKRQTEAWSCE